MDQVTVQQESDDSAVTTRPDGSHSVRDPMSSRRKFEVGDSGDTIARDAGVLRPGGVAVPSGVKVYEPW